MRNKNRQLNENKINHMYKQQSQHWEDGGGGGSEVQGYSLSHNRFEVSTG